MRLDERYLNDRKFEKKTQICFERLLDFQGCIFSTHLTQLFLNGNFLGFPEEEWDGLLQGSVRAGPGLP
jgi:hypothetical protein